MLVDNNIPNPIPLDRGGTGVDSLQALKDLLGIVAGGGAAGSSGGILVSKIAVGYKEVSYPSQDYTIDVGFNLTAVIVFNTVGYDMPYSWASYKGLPSGNGVSISGTTFTVKYNMYSTSPASYSFVWLALS